VSAPEMDKADRIREAERRFRELESERNRYDVLVGKLEREVRSDPAQQRDLDAMREKARLTHNQLRKARQELEQLCAGTDREWTPAPAQLLGLDQRARPIPHPAAGRACMSGVPCGFRTKPTPCFG
jgi:chromosome segregation ATPase